MQYTLNSPLVEKEIVTGFKSENGEAVPTRFHLYSGDIYDTEGDHLIEESLRRAVKKLPYNPKIEEKFKASGVDYDIEVCSSCGGKRRKIIYKVVKFLNG